MLLSLFRSTSFPFHLFSISALSISRRLSKVRPRSADRNCVGSAALAVWDQPASERILVTGITPAKIGATKIRMEKISGNTGKLRTLIVDDSSTMRKLVER
jgi:hypothetical protein